MSKALMIIIYIFLATSLNGQNKITANFKYKVTYELTYALDTTNILNKKKDYMILLIGEGISSFSSRAKLIKNTVVVKGNTAHTSPMAITDFQYVIIKNASKNFLAFTQQIAYDYFYYKQPLDLFHWELQPESKIIDGYEVQKATTFFSGRHYVAWFAPKIAISDGPYKFNGLPGLILVLSDTAEHYKFILKAFEKLKPELPFKINLNRYIPTTPEGLSEVHLCYSKDPFTYVSDPNIHISPEVHKSYIEKFAEIRRKNNNPIERDQ